MLRKFCFKYLTVSHVEEGLPSNQTRSLSLSVLLFLFFFPQIQSRLCKVDNTTPNAGLQISSLRPGTHSRPQSSTPNVFTAVTLYDIISSNFSSTCLLAFYGPAAKPNYTGLTGPCGGGESPREYPYCSAKRELNNASSWKHWTKPRRVPPRRKNKSSAIRK